MILWILLGIAAVLWLAASLTGMPEVFSYGMSAVLALLGAAIGLANWCILIRTWWTGTWSSLIPILGNLFLYMAACLSGFELLELLALVLDPWLLYMLIGLIFLPFRALGRCFRKREK